MAEHNKAVRRLPGDLRKEMKAEARVIRLPIERLSEAADLFASAFAREHDNIAINGMFLQNQTRQDNARIHQRLYDESRSSVAGEYGKVEVRLKVAKVRLLTPRVAVVHARSELGPAREEDEEHRNPRDAVARG
jgi:hypothetical protein